MRTVLTIVVEPIRLPQFIKDSEQLLRDHYVELSVDKDAHPLDPDWGTYEKLYDAGALDIIAAYDGEKMVGYSLSIFIPRNLHYPFAYVQNDVLFVARDHRQGGTAGRLMRMTKNWAKVKGAAQVLWHAKEGSELHRMLDSRSRFKLRDIIYSEDI